MAQLICAFLQPSVDTKQTPELIFTESSQQSVHERNAGSVVCETVNTEGNTSVTTPGTHTNVDERN